MSFPVSTTFVPSLGQTNQIKRIEDSQQKISLVLIPRSHNLRDAIFGQVDLVVFGQEPCRVSHVEQNTIGDHDQGLKDPKEPFVTNDGRNRLGVEPWTDTDLGYGKIFHGTVDGTDHDERAAAVERAEHRFQISWEQIGFVAFAVEIRCE